MGDTDCGEESSWKNNNGQRTHTLLFLPKAKTYMLTVCKPTRTNVPVSDGNLCFMRNIYFMCKHQWPLTWARNSLLAQKQRAGILSKGSAHCFMFIKVEGKSLRKKKAKGKVHTPHLS